MQPATGKPAAVIGRLQSAPAIVAGAVLLWCAVSWIIARTDFLFRADDLIRQTSQLTRVMAKDLAGGVQRNMAYLGGAPDLLSRDLRVVEALTAGPAGGRRAAGRRGARKATAALDQYLAQAKVSLNVDMITVVDAAGDCVAGSDRHIPCTGTNFADREFFRGNRKGKHGMQYAVGKTTHLAGLFFSSPVIAHGKFVGAVIAKVNVKSLSFLLDGTDAYVADRNGVVILASDLDHEMQAVPGAAVHRLAREARAAIYQRTDFPPLKIARWDDDHFESLLRVDDETLPHVVASAEIPAYGLRVYAQTELPEYLELQENRTNLFWLTFSGGTFLILLVASGFGYLRQMSAAKKEVEYQAHYDTLTQLPNRRLFARRLEHELEKFRRHGRPLALLLIDLDGFKEVNDTLGHGAGDALLKEAAARIHGCVRAQDTVARLGGDEFIVIVPESGERADIERIARCILGSLGTPFPIASESVTISASLGIVLCPDDATEMRSLLKYADQAMYAAKQAGRNRYSYFVPALEEAAQQKRLLKNELRHALARQELHVYYQPIVELKSGKLQKAEALLRWQHPVRGFISPGEFIALAETSGIITKIGHWVFERAVEQAALWRRQYDPSFQVSVNKSPVQFKDMASAANDPWIAHMQQQGLEGDSLCIEITEGTLLLGEDGIREKLLALSRAGIQVSIDDFGTGYSSLAYLKKFNIDCLKIDKTFVRDLATDRNDLALCEAIITMAHKLGLKVIAEGVETAEQRDILAGCGCDYAQGYLFSRPVPAHEFERLFGTAPQAWQAVPQRYLNTLPASA